MKNQNPVSQTLLSIIKFITLIGFCILCGFCIVTPLWYFSSDAPKVYTVTALSFIIAFFLYKIIKISLKTQISVIIKNLLVIAGLALSIIFSVKLVLEKEKILALIIFICGISFSILVTIIMKRFFIKDEN